MNESFSGLLNNILFVIFPLFLYHLFFFNDYQTDIFRKNKLFSILAFSSSILLCTLFPYDFLLKEEYHFDLRQVPIIIGTLYGGFSLGIWLFVISSMIRFFIGDLDGFYISFINHFAILIVLPLLQSKYFQLTLTYRLVVCAVISICSLVFNGFIGWLLFHDPIVSVLDQWAVLILNQSIFVVFTALIVERMIKTSFIHQALIKNEKLEIVSHLAASISHEIRNPLQVISGFTDLLKVDDVNKEKRQQFYHYISDEVQSAEKIISDYLVFAKPTFENVEVFNVLEELESFTTIISAYASKSGVLVTSELPSEKPCYIEGDRHKLKQCLINIAKNGLDALDSEGTLHIQARQENKYFTIEITDTGKGMTKEQIARLGEPYFSNKTSGTGLGLMVAYSIIKNMNGTILVESQVGSGTKFKIQLPVK